MKTKLSLACTFLAVALAAFPGYAQTEQQPAAGLTQQEREFAVKHLESTREKFLASIQGLSEAQWRFKPAPDRWSAAEVAEHVAVSESTLLGLVTERIVKQPPAPSNKEKVKGKDQVVIKVIGDRSKKMQAPEMLRPTGRWASREELTKAFEEGRAATIAYIKNTKDDLRSHFAPHPALDLLDAYQWILFIAVHSGRHTAQISEVKADPNFPKP